MREIGNGGIQLSQKPSLDAAARGNFKAVRDMFEHILSRVERLETKSSVSGFNTESQTPVAQPPAQASVKVHSPLTGNVVVSITNPEYLSAAKNPLKSPILHQVAYSRTADMKDAISLPIGTQTHYALPLSGRYFVQVKSSLDGATFNQAQKFEVKA